MTTPYGFASTGEEIADALASEIHGKNVLITGTSLGGLGAHVARVIAKHANLVIVAGSNDQRQQATVDSIKADLPDANLRKLIVDLSSLDAVRKAGAEVNAYSEPIHVLICNAAANLNPYSVTKEGVETQFAVNHLAHTLFATLILPRIRAARSPEFSPRIVIVGSNGHGLGTGVRFDDVNFGNGETYDKWQAYGQAKTANMLTAVELAKRLKDDGILAYSLHPGAIETNMANHVKADLIAFGMLDADGNKSSQFPWKTLSQGAATYVVAAFDPSIKDQSGSYLVDCQPHNDQAKPFATDPVLASKLWTLSEKLIGEPLVV